MLLKPDRLNGQRIFRGVDMGRDGINHQNEAILFPPTLVHGQIPCVPLAELVAEAQSKIQLVIEKGATPQTVSATTALMVQVRKGLAFWMKRATLNERERIRLALEKHGLKEAQHAILDGVE